VVEPRLHSQALRFVKNLRDAAPELRVRVHAGGGKLKNQLKRADQSGAHWALLFGEEELQNNRVAVKRLRETGDQVVMELPALVQHLKGEEY
jgi:histidyl-tRNA synthetase